MSPKPGPKSYFWFRFLLYYWYLITCGILTNILSPKSLVKLSDIQRNKCRVSIITWPSGMKLNKGISLQLNYFDLANLEISLNIFFAILARRSTSFFPWVSMVQRSKFALFQFCFMRRWKESALFSWLLF